MWTRWRHHSHTYLALYELLALSGDRHGSSCSYFLCLFKYVFSYLLWILEYFRMYFLLLHFIYLLLCHCLYPKKNYRKNRKRIHFDIDFDCENRSFFIYFTRYYYLPAHLIRYSPVRFLFFFYRKNIQNSPLFVFWMLFLNPFHHIWIFILQVINRINQICDIIKIIILIIYIFF